jgi:hypothetical protein
MVRSCRSLALVVLALTSCFALGQQYPGQNINMVSGTVWPAGDPYLQRQNEPSMAVSSRNGQHLLAGANDYRTVDIPNSLAPNILGDAWLGVYSSLDGGDTWKSTLLPGYPQDTSSVGTSSPLHHYTVATDPTVRAGTHGLFYYSGLAFNRGTGGASAVFVATFQDMNNKGNGDNAILTKDANGNVHGNPVQYLGVSLVDTGNTGQFLDKPWVAVDIPRPGRTATCKINGQTISSGYAYIVYTLFNGSQNNPSSKIKTAVSTNCGATWSQPQTLSQSMKLAQGTVASIDPTTGNVIVAWRQIASSNGSQPDAIQYAISTNGGNSFTNYPAPYTFVTASSTYPQGSVFDQPATSSTSTTFRTLDVPALAVDGSGRAWLAYSMRVNGPTKGTYGSRIMVQTLAPGAKSWSTAYMADSSLPLTKNGHQFMPSFSFAYGKLALAWFDSRRDNMQSVVSCPGGNCSNFAGGTVTDVPIPNSAMDPAVGHGVTAVFTPTITDPGTGVRHTLDIFGAVIDPSLGPKQFSAFQISQYPYYVNDNPSDMQLEQGFFNPPNLPMFVQGTTPFIGDYIDIASQGIIPSGNSWAFNTQGSDPKTGATIAPDFHITWTDNRDVVPPPVVGNKQDWTQYAPPNSGSSSTSTYSGTGGACPTCQTTQPACTTTTADDSTTASYSGDRNQNVYTSRISNGLLVQFKENAKAPSAGVPQRSFSLLVRNTVPPLSTTPYDAPSYFRVMLGVTSNTQTPVCNNASIADSANPCYVDLEVYPDTTQTPQIVVTSAASVNVLVAQIQSIPAPGAQPTFLPLQALAVINADPSNPAVVDADALVPDDSNPDIETQYPGNLIANGEEYYPTVDGPPDPTADNPDPSATVGFPAVFSPPIGTSTNSAPAVTVNTPKINTPKINTPKIASVQIANPKIVDTINTPKITTINTPKINTPKIAAPDIFTPKITNLSDNSGLTDYTWKVNNKGNTSSSYSTSEFVKSSGVTCCPAACSPNSPGACTAGCSICQLIQHKVYESPVANRDASNFNATCDLTVQQFSITVANIPDPAFGTDPSGSIGTGGSSTLSLSPGEGNRVTLRVVGPPAGQGQPVAPFKTQATSFSSNTGQGQPSASLILTSTALPVAVVGQRYVGAQLTASGGLGNLAFSVPGNIDNPVAATLPIPTQPLPVAPLTFNQAGQISTGVITASPGTYTADLQVQDSASMPSLDVQQLDMLVNRFSISSVDVNVGNTLGTTSYMKAGDQATVTVYVSNQGPATASNLVATLAPNPVAAGNPSGPLPSVTCTSPTGSSTISSNSTGAYVFTCTANSGNGYVNFTANANGQYANAPAATVTATAASFTDPAGTTSTPPNVIVDTALPTLTFAAPSPAPNANGWNNSNVTFAYTADDNLSGVNTSTPNPLVISTEGKNVTGQVVITDYAKNSQTFTSSPVNLDKTPPVVSVTSTYTTGVYTNQNVTIVFTCGDLLSGPAAAPAVTGVPLGATTTLNGFATTVVLTAETTGTTLQSTCQDKAGNTSPQASFGPVLIDKTAPLLNVAAVTTQSGGAAYAPNTWTNGNVTVVFSCADTASPVGANSGVAAPPTGNAVFTKETSNGTTTGMCVDVAGNVSSLPFGNVQIDKTPPVLTVSALTPAGAYSAGTWTNQPVTVTYSCTDTAGPANSGVAANNPTGSQTFTAETSSGSATGNCTDVAGNSVAPLKFQPVQVDLTPPAVMVTANLGSSTGPAYTAGTWTNQSVVVSVVCTDSLSGVNPLLTTGNLTANAQGTYNASSSCTDNVGNTASSLFGQILIDTTTPSAVIASPQSQAYILNSQITPNFACSDGSGGDIVTCTGTPSSSAYTAAPVGPSTFSVHAVDQAGNTSSPDTSVNYMVVYNFTGFQAPLQQAVFMNPPNPPTPPQPSDSGSFVTGTTVPIAWQLQDANNIPIQNLSSLVSIVAIANPNCAGSAAGTSTTLYNGTIGTTAFSYDNLNNRFVFNWNTTSFATGCYNLVLTTDDTAQYSTIMHIAADTFVGFDAPLASASAPANPANSGSFDAGATVPVMWQLQLPNGSLDTAGTNLQNVSAYVNANCTGAPPAGSANTVIYDLPTNTGSFNFEPSTSVYTVNWATGTAAPGCYDLIVTLADQSVYTTRVTLANQGASTTLAQYNFDNVTEGSASQTAPASYAAPGITAGAFGYTGTNSNGMFTNGCDLALCIDPAGVQSGNAYTFSFTNNSAISGASISFWEFNNDCQSNPGCGSETFSIQYDTSSAFSSPVTIATFAPNEPAFQKSNSFPISGTLAPGTYYFRIFATGTDNDVTAQYVFDDVTITGMH